MNLIRLLLIALVVWIAVLLLKRWLAGSSASRDRPVAREGRMLRCDHCGLHIPEADAIRDGEHNYCCTEHRDAARRR